MHSIRRCVDQIYRRAVHFLLFPPQYDRQIKCHQQHRLVTSKVSQRLQIAAGFWYVVSRQSKPMKTVFVDQKNSPDPYLCSYHTYKTGAFFICSLHRNNRIYVFTYILFADQPNFTRPIFMSGMSFLFVVCTKICSVDRILARFFPHPLAEIYTIFGDLRHKATQPVC